MNKLFALSVVALVACTGQVLPSDPAPTTGDPPAVIAGSCTDAWCVSAVIPVVMGQGNHDLQNVWAASPSDAWAADFFGHLYHWNGQSWLDTPTAAQFYGVSGVWGTSSNDVWADGEFGIEHWDGTSWSITPRGGYLLLQEIWGTSSNDVWALGGGFTLEHWDGSRWSEITQEEQCCDFTHAWGAAPNDVWAVSDSGFAHWDGASWTAPEQELSQIAEGLWGFGPNDVWAVGQFGIIGHYDGAKWTEVRAARDGQPDLFAVWGSGPNDVWAVGDAGTILHWDGARWSASPSGVTSILEGVYGTSAGDVWAVGSNVILHHG